MADRNPDKGMFCKRGLWRYSRHPNYFGEALLWYGIWLIACSIKWGWASFFSPLMLSLLVRFVTGVPLLEERHKDNEEFKQYKAETNTLIPWINKKLVKP